MDPTQVCPICNKSTAGWDNSAINRHLDTCLTEQSGLLSSDSPYIPEPSVLLPDTQINHSLPFLWDSLGMVLCCPVEGCEEKIEIQKIKSHVEEKHKEKLDAITAKACIICDPEETSGDESYLDHMAMHIKQFCSFASGFKEPPPEKPILRSLPKLTGKYAVTKITTKLKGECTICYEDFEIGEEIATLECMCYYHAHCIRSWFMQKRECPFHAID